MATSIELILLNDCLSGIIKCNIGQWLGVAYKFPRSKLGDLKNRTELNQAGIYFLFGGKNGEKMAYVGQASTRKNDKGLLMRLNEHNKNPDKDFWEETVVFTASDNSLGATELNYLENTFYDLIKSANKFSLKNDSNPPLGNISEITVCNLSKFIDKSKIIMELFGYKIFEPSFEETQTNEISSTANNQLYLSRYIRQIDKKIQAVGVLIPEGFKVLRGSQISPIEDITLSETMKNLRKSSQVNNNYELLEDIIFSSPSNAAIFVTGKSTNGLTAWKDNNNNPLKEILNSTP